MKNFKSRKFLMSLASFLASVGASITGLCIENQVLATTGMVCTVVSAAIYGALEAWIDGKAVKQSAAKKDLAEPVDEYIL